MSYWQVGDVALSGMWLAPTCRVAFSFSCHGRLVQTSVSTVVKGRRGQKGRPVAALGTHLPLWDQPLRDDHWHALVVYVFMSFALAWKTVRITLNCNDSLYTVHDNFKIRIITKFRTTAIISPRFYCSNSLGSAIIILATAHICTEFLYHLIQISSSTQCPIQKLTFTILQTSADSPPATEHTVINLFFCGFNILRMRLKYQITNNSRVLGRRQEP